MGDFDRIIRVFPRRTNATPDDSLAFTKAPAKNDLSTLAFREWVRPQIVGLKLKEMWG